MTVGKQLLWRVACFEERKASQDQYIYIDCIEKRMQGVEIYAGVRRLRSGELTPTGTGRLCNWTPDAGGPLADEFPSFGAYQRSLTLVCEEGSPGVVVWTPGPDTPDTVYYQVPRCRSLVSRSSLHLLI